MAIWQGTFFAQLFVLMDCKTNTPIDLTGWEFAAQFRIDVEDEPPLLELTSAAGEFVIHDPKGGMFSMQIQPADTETLPADETLSFDILRTAPDPGPILLLYGKVPVRQPVTRI